MKRLLCLLLALVMCAGLAVSAAAEEPDPVNPDNPVTPQDPPASEPTITLSKNELELYVGDSDNLTATTDNYNGTVSWESSDTGVATVSGGLVTAVSPGSAVITAKLTDREGIPAACSVTVQAKPVKNIVIKTDGSNKVKVNDEIQLNAYAIYEDETEKKIAATWSSDNNEIATVSPSGLVTAVSAGDAIITATPEDPELAKLGKNPTFSITVTAPEVPPETPTAALVISGSGIVNSSGKYTLSMSVGDNDVTLSAKLDPAGASSENITWTSSDESVATVSAGGVVSAKKEGTAAITASCGGVSARVEVTVSPASSKSVSDITASTTKSKNLSFSDIFTTLKSRYKGQYNNDPTNNAEIVFSSPLGSSGVGTLYESSSSSAKAIAANNPCTLSKLKSFYFKPSGTGKYELSYTLTEKDSTNSITGKITITVKEAAADITVSLSDDSKAYTFSTASNLEKTKGTSLISTAISGASGQTYSHIKFGSVSSSSKKVGTLYASSSEKSLSTTAKYTYKSGTYYIGNLYFVPKNEGTYSIPYTAYDADGEQLCSGSLMIVVGVTNDTTVTVTLDDDGSYTFSSRTKKDKASAATAIDEMIKDEAGTYSYIRFGSIVSGSNVGTLYADSDETKLNTSTQYKRSASAANSVSDLYFVPEKSGTYVRSFTAYGSDGKKMLDGTLKIVVPSDSDSEMDIYFNTSTGSTVSLSENVFESWFRQQKGTNYKLAYVTFDDASRSYGSFKHSSSSFAPGNDVKYFTEGFTGSTGSSPKYLDNVKYTAPSSTGYVSVDFTCYGGTSSSAYSTKVSGSFFIFVTKSSVKGVTRDVKYGSAVTLKESEFSAVHESAMSLSSTSSGRYYIELLEIPSKGTLYYNYTSASKPGTRLTGSNYDDYKFYVNSSSSYDSVSDLTYVPANTSSGNVSVRYLARSTNGDPMYVGSISFVYGRQQGATISCGSDGYTFKASDFYSSSDSDPVAYVTFTQPNSGELMLGYAKGRGVPLDSSVRLYTSKSTDGSYPLSSLSYIPKAGFSGNVEINYTAVTEAGKAQNGVLTIAVTSRKGSAHFKDVSSSGSGAWASDAIDFAYKWGLVNGTGTDTFSPDNTMTRAMLVTILYRSAGSPKVSGSCPFTDVAAGTYYYDAVIWASGSGIVTGTSATTFSPDRDVNREQVATFLHRYAKYNGENVAVTDTLNGYADKSSVSQYAIEPLCWAVQHGYITSNSGTSELLLSPGGNATRAQVAVMLHRFLTY
ncbi:MAG: Ig-like domain-containing protein [Butyricicoccus sp.]|nr:Ig-like domain-containing protein [Butyricicoccus sp.]